MQTMIHTALLYFVTEMKLLIVIVLVLNMSLTKLKNLVGIKTSKLTFFEYKQKFSDVRILLYWIH